MTRHPGRGALAGHDRHGGHSPRGFRDRFWAAAVLTVPVNIWSLHIEALLGYTTPAVPRAAMIPAVRGTAVFLVGGVVFLRAAVGELRDRRPRVMTLIALAISVAFVFSWSVVLGVAVNAQSLTRVRLERGGARAGSWVGHR